MIRIGKYGIEAADKCYAIGTITSYTNKQTHEVVETLANVGYYSDIASALQAIVKRNRLDTMKSFDGDLKQAVKAITEVDEAIKLLIKEALPK